MRCRAWVASVLIATSAGCLVWGAGARASSKDEQGVFFDYPVQGLNYAAAPSGLKGQTGADGSFRYRKGDEVTFTLGGIVLGSAKAAAWLTPIDLVPDAKGDVAAARLNNIGMLIESLDERGSIEDGIQLSKAAHAVARKHAGQLQLDQPSADFYAALDRVVMPDFLTQAGVEPNTGGPMKNADESGRRRARTPEMARNQLRRTAAGIMRLTDVKIPLRDYDAQKNPDAYLLGTLHRPVGPKAAAQVPTVLNVGVYGKDKIFGSICTIEQFQAQERVDDRFRSGNPDKRPYENHETVDTFEWVPNGYAVLRVDEAGIGRSPGELAPWSHKSSLNYVDVIDWAGRQSWSNRRVGTIGISYYAMTQWLMAEQLPKDSPLKAMIPWEGGADTYRDDMYPGGLFLQDFFRMWSFGTSHNHCGNSPPVDVLKRWADHPFYDPEIWDDHAADFSKITVPFLSAAGVDNMSLHPRGNDMAYRLAASSSKLLRIQSGGHIHPFYEPHGVADQMAFFDYWLKGIDTGIMRKPPVKIAVKTGDTRGYYWTYADQWPLAATQYTKFYLDARSEPSGFKVDGTMPVYQLHPSTDRVTASSNASTGAPRVQAKASYSAVVQPVTQVPGPPPPRFNRPQRCDTHGISFATPPLAETITLAGHAKLVTWVSSSTEDMDLHVSLRVYDENGKQVNYSTEGDRIDVPETPPIQVGRLKVSQRALDTARSTFFQPVHTHREADSRKLKPGEIVPVEVEFWPMTAEIRKGHRVVVDIQPYHGCGHAWPHKYGDYNTGSNTIHTGPGHESFIQLPIVPGLKPRTDVAWAPDVNDSSS